MNKFDSILDGMNFVDREDSVGGYNYYGFVRHNGEWVIMRLKTDETELRFAMGGTGYTTAWTNKTTQTYGYGIKA
ncbi:MAG: hypothetical protein WC516_05740 [Patescibacteria group bacterium]|jgi:hypothetical protein